MIALRTSSLSMLWVLLFSVSSYAKGPVSFEHSSGKVTFENRWEGEPNNEPHRLWVTVECKKPGKDGKVKHEVVTDWLNCGLKDFKWDQYHSRLELILMHKNRQNNFEACSLEDKRSLLVTDFCAVKTADATQKKKDDSKAAPAKKTK